MEPVAGHESIRTWLVKHVVSPLDRASFHWLRGHLRASGNRPVLLLTTTGHKSGKRRTTPVFYVRDDEDLVVCNVRPPGERANPWPKNLDADPSARVQLGSETIDVTARRATDEDCETLWPRLTDIWPTYQAYFDATGERHIFRLHPLDTSA